MSKTLRIFSLLLAIFMLAAIVAACGDKKDPDGTTTTTAAPANSTTTLTQKITEAVTTTAEEIEIPIKTETPAIGDDADKFDETYNKITVVEGSVQTEGYNSWNAAEQGADRLFDGTDNKMGGDVAGGVLKVTFQIEPAKLAAYVLVTGGDSDVWTGRTPTAWVLRGSNDGTTWTDIDVVEDSAMEDIGNQSYGYTVDADKQAEYTYLQFEFTESTNITQGFVQFQLNELKLYTGK